MLFKKNIPNLFRSNTIININRSVKLNSISLKISKNCIYVTAPYLLSHNKINEFLKKKLKWIKKQLFIQDNIQPLIKKKYLNGEVYKYLGKTYNLQITKGIKYSIKIENNLLIVTVKDIKNIIKVKSLINKWFHNESISYFEERTFFYAKENDLKPTSVKVREYKARWGSCSLDGNITFNWRLIMAPPKIIKYVIIHELVHLIEHNHSPKYWRHVKKLYPDFNDAKDWLIFNGKTLNV